MRAIVTSPEVTLARQVPQTPPLQANGRSARVACAESRIAAERGIAAVEDRPSSTIVTSLVSPVTTGESRTSSGGGSST